MDKAYIQPTAAVKKLKTARSFSHTIYIYGATGYGKTELVKQYLMNRRYVHISCADEGWDFSELPRAIEKKNARTSKVPVVIDDLQFLDDDKRQKVKELIERDDIWLILVSRSPVPPWLRPDCVRCGFMVIDEKDLRMGVSETSKLMETFRIQLNQEQLRQMVTESEGNARVIVTVAKMMLRGVQLGSEMQKEVSELFSNYIENEIFGQWSPELLEFLMKISVTDTFTVPLAEMVTGNPYVRRFVEMAFFTGNFITEKDGVYSLRPILLKVLRHRAEIVCGREYVRECAYNAGLYYEMHDQISQALEMYEKYGWLHRIRGLLIRNARRNPGNGHYFELRRYYLGLSEEEVGENVFLMSAMSMLYSLMLQPEKSEYWYEKLKTYENTARGRDRQEARSRLGYLDIALPHRGSRGMLHIMKNIPSVLFDKGIRLPEFSVTSNIPSIMNGGKDFCHWSKYDRELAVSVGKLVQRVLGRYGIGLVNASLGESLYEKGGDKYEILTLLTRSEMETLGDGMPEITFAAVGIRARLYCLNGDIKTAKMQIDSFEKRVREENVVQLLPNIEALKCRMALYEGDYDRVARWMQMAPDENQEFCALERYRYLTKVRCYIASGELLKALALLEKMRYYAEICKRTCIMMEVKMLTAVIRYRQGEEWQSGFMEMLREASEYRFLRLISEEGAGVSELLRKIKKEVQEDAAVDQEWFEKVLNESTEVAVRYPLYLKQQLSSAVDFSENALAILRLQAEGLSIRKIAEKLGIKPETVKYHTKENYRKLGVSGKTDAVLAARDLNLL